MCRSVFQASANTTDPGALQKSEEFITAFNMGFELADAIALLRVDDLYVGKSPSFSFNGVIEWRK